LSEPTPYGQYDSRMSLQVKNMVSTRDLRTITELLENTGSVKVERISLGTADIHFNSAALNFAKIAELIRPAGFDLILDKDDLLFEQIKVSVLEMIYYGNNLNTIIRNSDYLSDKLGHPYIYLSKLFSEKTRTTLEKYIILVKIERVKELLSYDEMTLSEIAYQMGYSSVQYLSNQFRQVTGFSVSEYRQLKDKPRIPLDKLLD
jgi:AraC family transcriptional regulator